MLYTASGFHSQSAGESWVEACCLFLAACQNPEVISSVSRSTLTQVTRSQFEDKDMYISHKTINNPNTEQWICGYYVSLSNSGFCWVTLTLGPYGSEDWQTDPGLGRDSADLTRLKNRHAPNYCSFWVSTGKHVKLFAYCWNWDCDNARNVYYWTFWCHLLKALYLFFIVCY